MSGAHEPSRDCISARLAWPARTPLAVELERDVLARLAGHDWVPYAGLLALAPEGRITVIPELDGEEPYGYDSPRGPAYDAGPSGQPDAGMLGDVLAHLRELMLLDEGYPQDAGRSFRLYDLEERIGLGEIGERLAVKRDTVDHWRVRGVLPETGETEGRRPRWPWRVIREWAFATGRNPGGPNAPRWRWVPGTGGEVVVDGATSDPVVQ